MKQLGAMLLLPPFLASLVPIYKRGWPGMGGEKQFGANNMTAETKVPDADEPTTNGKCTLAVFRLPS